MKESSADIFQFIVDALKVSGSPFNIINSELIMAQCQVAVPRTFFSAARVENLNLQMVCQPDIVAKYPGSELVVKGSYRLQWFIDGIRERGLITTATIPYDLDPKKAQREIIALLREPPEFYFERPTLIFQPELLVNFRVGFETDEKIEELYSLGINLVNGAISSNLLAKLMGRKISPHPPKKYLEKRKISYREGYGGLLNHLRWLLQNHDPGWIQAAKARWDEEVNYLESFFQENNPEEAAENEAGFYRRLAEGYRKFRPVIKIHIINVGLLYLPKIRYALESYTGEKSALIYDPVNRKAIATNLETS
ncbi:MAG: YqhG family protein [Bacillota bacterium]